MKKTIDKFFINLPDFNYYNIKLNTLVLAVNNAKFEIIPLYHAFVWYAKKKV